MKGILLIVIGVALIRYYMRDKERVCLAERTITSIGGCDRGGTCGVTYSEGWTGKAVYPTIGQVVCINSELRKK